MAVFAVVMVDLFGLDKLTNAFGSMSLFQGAATIVGPPTIGAMKTFFGSYSRPFIMTGFILTFSGLLCLFIRPLKTFLEDRKKEEITSQI